MNRHYIRLAVLATALAASGAASAMPAAVPSAPDLCVVYPYYGQTSTSVPGWIPATESAAADDNADPCVIYPYYGETSTPVPGWTPAVEPMAAARPATRAVIDEWGVVETAEDLERVLAAYGRGQYLGL
jgi:hypothetical protein